MESYKSIIKKVISYPLIGLSMIVNTGCSDRIILDNINHTERLNSNGTRLTLEVRHGTGYNPFTRQEQYVYVCSPIINISELNKTLSSCVLASYTNREFGSLPVIKVDVYDDRSNIVEKAVLEIKEPAGKKIIENNGSAVLHHLMR